MRARRRGPPWPFGRRLRPRPTRAARNDCGDARNDEQREADNCRERVRVRRGVLGVFVAWEVRLRRPVGCSEQRQNGETCE